MEGRVGVILIIQPFQSKQLFGGTSQEVDPAYYSDTRQVMPTLSAHSLRQYTRLSCALHIRMPLRLVSSAHLWTF